jgi:S-adenosylmethionine synthetase
MDIIIEKIKNPIEKQRVEFVERKGLGHPDSICDLACDAVSIALSKEYIKRFGTVLHHNVDKALLVGGKSAPEFKGGKIIEPFKLIVAGRVTSKIGNEKINVKKIAEKAVNDLMKQYRYLKNNYKFIIDVKEGAANLKEVFKRKATANDTSFGTSHYPFSRLEKLVKKTTDVLSSEEFLARYKAVGEDIKVMGVRVDNKFKLTVAIAFVDRFVANMNEYINLKFSVLKYLKNSLGKNIDIEINTLDDISAKTASSVYLTVTGLSSEMGDDGNTGRGNRINGLITPNRPMSFEAAGGKNINHPGKLYQVLAYEIAKKVSLLKGIKECNVKLVSQIGRPLNKPQAVSVEVYGENSKVKEVVLDVLDNIEHFQKEITKGKYLVV